jgi:predicted phage terminase large subunit-like protein
MIFMPPRHTKSEFASRRFPAWYLGRNPSRQVIAASYNSDLATDFGRDVRNLVADRLYNAIFPDVSLKADSKAADRWNTNHGGVYISAGVGSGITGRGANLGIIDDPFKDRKEAESQTIRDNVWNWYRSTFYTRLMPGAAIVLTLTRWHEDDLAGRLIQDMKQGGDQWTIIKLPALAEDGDGMGRQEGEPLWPEWYPLTTLTQIRNVLGTYEWNALYQQRPVSEQGNIFKKTWWRRYIDIPEKPSLKIHAWDTAFKNQEENDYSVCLTMAIDQGNIYIIDRFKAKLEFPELKRAAMSMAYRDKVNAIVVEDKASGQSLIQELRRESKLSVIPYKVDRDKVARAYSVTPMIEGGRVYLPEWGSWVEDYIADMSSFPSGLHDDDVDATTVGLSYCRNKIDNVEIDDVFKMPSILGRMDVSWMGA